MKRSNKGFTLVELIVVLAIIGILSAMLVPSLVSYITDSKLRTANSNCKNAYTAVNSYCQKCLTAGKAIRSSSGTVVYLVTPQSANLASHSDNTPVYGVASAGNLSIQNALNDCVYKGMGSDSEGSVLAVEFGSDGFPTCCIWSADSDDITKTGSTLSVNSRGFIGGYPRDAQSRGWTLARAKNG